MMPSPKLSPDVFSDNQRTAPPSAPPAQPGEIRGCLRCERCVEVIPKANTSERYIVRCSWQGEWWFPTKGCDRWALRSEALTPPKG